jgi:hypothetical protein
VSKKEKRDPNEYPTNYDEGSLVTNLSRGESILFVAVEAWE